MATITFRVSLEIDVDEWAAEYGVHVRDVPRDVRAYVQNALNEMPVRPRSVGLGRLR